MLQFSIKTIRHGICVDDVSLRSNIHSISSLKPAAEMCGNVLPYFWRSCAINMGGEKVEATCCTPRFPPDTQQRMKPPCVGGQEPKHQPRAWSSYQSRQTSTCQLRLFLGAFPSRRGFRSHRRVKGGWQKYERCLCNLCLPCADTSRDTREHWMTLWGLLFEGGGGIVQPSAAWDRIWTVILSSSILPPMTW